MPYPDSPAEAREPLVIVGGGPAGLAVARSYREGGGTGRVVLVSADDDAPYERPPLSKDFLAGESDETDLPLEDRWFYDDARVELRLGTRVTGLSPGTRTITLSSGEVLRYGRCVLATGGTPVVPDLPGLDRPEVLVLRSLVDARRLRTRARDARSAVVVGSGFIGCEAAASLRRRGLEVTLVSKEETPHARRLGSEIGTELARWLTEDGVTLVTGHTVAACRAGGGTQGSGAAVTVILDDDRRLAADLVVLAVGVRPDSHLAVEAGLTVVDDRVRTDRWMRSSDPSIYAVGDVAMAFNAAAGRPLAVEHWGEALVMGAVAGTVLAGGEAFWSQAPGFWSTIGRRTLKYTAWGDGFDTVRLVRHGSGGFTAWYGRDQILVGALTHEADDDYARAAALIEAHASISAVLDPM